MRIGQVITAVSFSRLDAVQRQVIDTKPWLAAAAGAFAIASGAVTTNGSSLTSPCGWRAWGRFALQVKGGRYRLSDVDTTDFQSNGVPGMSEFKHPVI